MKGTIKALTIFNSSTSKSYTNLIIVCYTHSSNRNHEEEVRASPSPRNVPMLARNQSNGHDFNQMGDSRNPRMTPEVMMTILTKGMEWFSNNGQNRQQ